jgi:hypothetical protein
MGRRHYLDPPGGLEIEYLLFSSFVYMPQELYRLSYVFLLTPETFLFSFFGNNLLHQFQIAD